MGIRATMTVTNCTSYRAFVKGTRSPGQPEDEGFDLDKAWSDLQAALNTFGEPLTRAFTGDYTARNNGVADEWCYFASPPLAKRIAAELASLPFERVAAALPEGNRRSLCYGEASHMPYLEYHYGNLTRAYALAAQRGAAVHVEIG